MESQSIEARSIEISVKSATDLKKSKVLSKTRAYAVAFIHGGGKRSRNEHITSADKENGPNPKWNHAMSFTLAEASLHQDRLFFTVQIWNDSTWGPHLIGHVTVPLKELVMQPLQNAKPAAVSYQYQVLTPSGKPKGSLNLSVKMGNRTKIQIKQHTHRRSQGNGLYPQVASQALMVTGISSNFF